MLDGHGLGLFTRVYLWHLNIAGLQVAVLAYLGAGVQAGAQEIEAKT